MAWTMDLDTAGRIVWAAVLGLVIGFEREHDGHAAGTRTFGAVALGAAVFGVVSTEGFLAFDARRASTDLSIDVTRVASQVVVGIGFLGAGLILRQGSTVRNLTTAAALWTVAAVGLSAGVGAVGLATLSAAVILVVLVVVPWCQAAVLRRIGMVSCRLRCSLDPGHGPAWLRGHLGGDLVVRAWKVSKREGEVVVDLRLTAPRDHDLDDLVEALAVSPEVRSLSILS